MAGFKSVLFGAVAVSMLVLLAQAEETKDTSVCLKELVPKIEQVELSDGLGEWLSKVNISEDEFSDPSKITKEKITAVPAPDEDCEKLRVALAKFANEVGECIYDIDYDVGEAKETLANNKKIEIFVNGAIACKVYRDNQ